MDSMNDLRNKCYVGILVAGGIAGACEQAWQNQNPAYNFFLGLILTCLASFAGGLAGFCFKNTLRMAAKRALYTGPNGHGVLMGALSGAVMGILFSALLFTGMPTIAGCAAGSALGAFLGALPDGTLGPILQMILEREQALKPKPTETVRRRISHDTPWTIGCYKGKVRITDSKEEDHVQILRLRPTEGNQVPEDAQGDGARP